uniref:ABC transporter n=1 Tax=uncultured marine crenarchaeote E37-7F TaxID=907717 RepID=G9BAN1_9ARCH|nr:ABC transporter [uncultured marine crenarchaeote E37-7F]
MFKLYRLPIPQPGIVLGLIGKNGIGKSTALKILAGEIKPNLGEFENPPDWIEIIKYYRGSVLQEFFKKIKEGKLKVVHKPQYVDRIPKIISGSVKDILDRVDERNKADELLQKLQLEVLKNREVEYLSGGELQRLAIATAICREAEVYLFDEPSSYLDVQQRIAVAKVIRSLKDSGKSIIVAEHDLTILDYLSDQVSVLYGEPAIYGVVCHPQGVRVGINIYLNGYIPDENIRFRNNVIRFHIKPPTISWNITDIVLNWERMRKTYQDFALEAEGGKIHKGEVIGIVGPNGIGKTTFIKLLAGLEDPDKGDKKSLKMSVSYKPQYITADQDDTVESILRAIVKDHFDSSQYKSEMIRPLSLEKLLDRTVNKLSGGELQRVAIATCLSKTAELYLIDEPSAYLDVEERLAVARTIRRTVENHRVTAFVAEHDVAAQDFIADRIMVFDGEPGLHGRAHSPKNLRDGMNSFLKIMGITFRRDLNTGRPRVNKEDSRLDRYQKSIGEYYYIPEKNK